MRDAKFKNSFIFKYSPRPARAATSFIADDVPEEVKKRRNNDLLAIQNAASLADHRRYIGQRVEVLVEGPSKNAWKQDTSGPVQLTGRTRTDHIVVFDGNPRFAGQTMQIDIADATSFTLYGDVVTGEQIGVTCCELPTEQTGRIALPLLG